MATTTFERVGGFATVRKVISAFYDRVLDSPRLAPYFEHVEMRRLIDHQTKFISSVMGGPGAYTDDHLRRVHEHLGISHDDFEELVGLLGETLEDFDVAPADVAAVLTRIRRYEPAIVSGVRA